MKMMIDNKVLKIYKVQMTSQEMTSQESRTSEPPEKIPYLCPLLRAGIWRHVCELKRGLGMGIQASDVEERV